MCGRYALFGPNTRPDALPPLEADWSERVSLLLQEFQHYNIAPTARAPIFLTDPYRRGNQVECQFGRWGLVPKWSFDPNPRFATFNARTDTVREKPAFREAWRKAQRCLVPVSGWYEWQHSKSMPIPYLFQHSGTNPMMLAGIWENSHHGLSFSILTTEALDPLLAYHDRQPILLQAEQRNAWLFGSDVEDLLKPRPLPVLAKRVSVRLNNVRLDDATLLESEV